jgi:TonB family protein
MPRDRSFWHNLTIIGLLHVVVLFGIARWSSSAKQPLGRDIVWMDSGATQAFEENTTASATNKEEKASPNDEEDSRPIASEEKHDEPILAATPSDLPLATPSPAATPRPAIASPTPKPIVKATPKPSPKPTPKKKLIAKASATPKQMKRTPASSAKTPDASIAKGENGSGGHAGGAGNSSQFAWYGNMLHNRFFSEWDQPTSVVASGVKMSVLVRLRIEKDGRVSDFALVRPSGNVVVDESVAAVAKRVTQVDPLPTGLGNGGHYDVNINFELNAE